MLTLYGRKPYFFLLLHETTLFLALFAKRCKVFHYLFVILSRQKPLYTIFSAKENPFDPCHHLLGAYHLALGGFHWYGTCLPGMDGKDSVHSGAAGIECGSTTLCGDPYLVVWTYLLFHYLSAGRDARCHRLAETQEEQVQLFTR